MNGRFMRVLVFFDLPVETKADRREYARFRRGLIKDGFLMMQESVYCKLALNPTSARSIMEAVRARRPSKGLVQMLVITEKQFSRMEFVVGDYHTQIIDNEERLVIV
ncbi:CRISPR-associated endonuclease Cas2 [uncultured Allofournierella sp.]|uniref:CRISPR-associated endonuclease Cas2 n=1 Tax=uncultured Allofournierella sp. TaxID=1940258 RepID=UPI003753214D